MNIETSIRKICNNFCLLTDACLTDMLAHIEIIELEKKQLFVKAGEIDERLYFVISGGIIGYFQRDKKEVVDVIAVEDEMVVSFDSFFFGRAGIHYFQAFEPSILAAITRKDLHRLENKYMECTYLMEGLITQYLIKYQLKIGSFQFEPGRDRYEKFAIERPDIMERLSLKDIASYIGITSETMSRLRKAHKKEKIGDNK